MKMTLVPIFLIFFVSFGTAQTKFDWSVAPKDLTEINSRILNWQSEYNKLTAGKKIDQDLIEAVLRLNLARGGYFAKEFIPFYDQIENDVSEDDWTTKYPAINHVLRTADAYHRLFWPSNGNKSVRWDWTKSLNSPLGDRDTIGTETNLQKLVPATDLMADVRVFYGRRLTGRQQVTLTEKLSSAITEMLKSSFPGFPQADGNAKDGSLDYVLFTSEIGTIGYGGPYNPVDFSQPEPSEYVDSGK